MTVSFPSPACSKPELTIAVRALAEHVLMAGDLSFSFAGTQRSLEGMAGHRRVQASRPAGYRAEVPVACRVETERFVLTVAGRIDGVWDREDGVVVDEIKTTARSVDDALAEENPVHWGQARLYAHMLAAERGLETVGVQLTYYRLGTGEIRERCRPETRSDLAAFFDRVVGRYLAWAGAAVDWNATRDASIDAIAFPFPRYRPGQREMAVAVYRALRDGQPLLAQAPTGIGKTMAVWFPAIKALGAGVARRIFFLTARTTGRTVAEDALDRLRSAGLRFRVVTLTAKDKLCFCPEAGCDPEVCAYARGHYDRLDRARQAALAHQALTRPRIESIAREHRVCPFAFSLALIDAADAVIGDYNYSFDPRVRLRFLEEGDDGGRLLLVDEAHNLVDRAREMYSAGLSKEALLAVRRRVKEDLPGVYRALGRVNRELVTLRRQCAEAGGERAEDALPEDLLPPLRRFSRLAEAALLEQPGGAWRPDLLECFFTVGAFLRTADGYDARYTTLYTGRGSDLTVRLFCLDPSPPLAEIFAAAAGTVCFSATLTPAAYFAACFGLPSHTRCCRLPSPFPPERLAVFAVRGISTYYRDRAGSVEPIAAAVAAVAGSRAGNYLAFFPSYAYLDQVWAAFTARWPLVAVRRQTPAMTETERDVFLAWFSEDADETRLGFAVLGGVFGEGIDLVGERLSGAVIVGVGLPAICLERERIRRFFDGQKAGGFDFAYRYPGIIRVLQAAGRVIRSARDRGVVVFLDERYAQAGYGRLVAPYWTLRWVKRAEALGDALADFWARDDSERIDA